MLRWDERAKPDQRVKFDTTRIILLISVSLLEHWHWCHRHLQLTFINSRHEMHLQSTCQIYPPYISNSEDPRISKPTHCRKGRIQDIITIMSTLQHLISHSAEWLELDQELWRKRAYIQSYDKVYTERNTIQSIMAPKYLLQSAMQFSLNKSCTPQCSPLNTMRCCSLLHLTLQSCPKLVAFCTLLGSSLQ